MNAKDIFSSENPVGVVYRGNTPNGLQFVRSLGEAGVPALALSDGSRAARMYSRYAYPMRCPDGLRQSSEFIHFLEELGQRLTQKAVLFLMNDPHLIVVAQHRDLLRINTTTFHSHDGRFSSDAWTRWTCMRRRSKPASTSGDCRSFQH